MKTKKNTSWEYLLKELNKLTPISRSTSIILQKIYTAEKRIVAYFDPTTSTMEFVKLLPQQTALDKFECLRLSYHSRTVTNQITSYTSSQSINIDTLCNYGYNDR